MLPSHAFLFLPLCLLEYLQIAFLVLLQLRNVQRFDSLLELLKFYPVPGLLRHNDLLEELLLLLLE